MKAQAILRRSGYIALVVTVLLIMTLMQLFVFQGQASANASLPLDNNSCQLTVPASPLTATGLSTPWQLQSPCHEGNANQQVFVQAVIFDPATKALSEYSPLVVDAGTTPAVAPTTPTLPAGSVVGIFGGGNDDATMLVDPSGACVNGANGRNFGQVFFCGTSQLFAAVNAAHVAIPQLGVGKDGLPCPTVRDFRIVDQDQSDNVQTTYLVSTDGTTAQNTASNRAALPGASVAKNGSDNRLLSNLVDSALGCTPWMVPDLADGGNLVPTQATDELQAAAYQSNQALVPAGDPMVGPNDLALLNAYRTHVDQPRVHRLAQANTQAYCTNMLGTAPVWLANDQALLLASPSPAAGVNLYDFMLSRFMASINLLGCKMVNFGQAGGDFNHHNHDRGSK